MLNIRDRVKELRRMKASDLLPHPKNWRKHPQQQQDAMRGILAEVGYADAVLARETPEGIQLIDGHLRAETTPDAEIPVLIVDVTEAEALKILATHDPLAAMAETDLDALGDLVAEIDFDSPALDEMLSDMMPDEPAEIVEDEVPAVQEQAISQRGDIWTLGDHRLMCGDSTDGGDVSLLLDGAVPFIMVTDPPYGVNYNPEWRNDAAAAGHLAYAASRVGKVVNDDRVDWSDAYLLFPGDVAYTWSPGGDHVILTGQAMQKAGFEIRNQIIWSKPHFPISRGAYTYQHEPCWYGVRKGKKAKWVGDNNSSTVWRISLDKNVEGGHSTQKPVECMYKPIRNHGDKDDDVYEPFSGSGTTIAASEQLHRRCFAMEIEPRYVDVAIRRWEKLTEQNATLDGKTFRDVAVERGTSQISQAIKNG